MICTCEHPQDHHVSGVGQCLARAGDSFRVCQCRRFAPKEAAQAPAAPAKKVAPARETGSGFGGRDQD